MRTLAWLRWKQFVGAAGYWLKLVDYDTSDRDVMNRAYGIYLLLFFVWWTAAMWAIAANIVAGIGQALPQSARDAVLAFGPPVVVAAQALLVLLALRSSPFKLSLPDIAYLAGSPVSRAPMVLLGFIASVGLPLPLAVLLASFLGVALAQPLGTNGAIQAGLLSAVVVIPVLVLSWGIAWVIGLVRMAAPRLRRWPLWLAAILLLPAGWVLPGPLSDAVTLPGRVLFSVTLGLPGAMDSAGLIVALAALSIVLLTALGSRANMIDVADESAVYAKLKEIGNLRWQAPSVYNRARRQMKAARRKPILRLPPAPGIPGLVARSMVSYLRNPVALAQCLLATGVILLAVGLLGYQQPPLFIVVVLWAAAMSPTGGLVYVFNADVEDRFLRQFLRLDVLRLLAGDAAPATVLVAVISGALWLIQPLPPAVLFSGLLLIGVLAVLLTLCRAASLLPLTLWRARVSHAVLAVICVGLTVGAGLLFGGLMAAVVAGALVMAVLASLVAESDSHMGCIRQKGREWGHG